MEKISIALCCNSKIRIIITLYFSATISTEDISKPGIVDFMKHQENHSYSDDIPPIKNIPGIILNKLLECWYLGCYFFHLSFMELGGKGFHPSSIMLKREIKLIPLLRLIALVTMPIHILAGIGGFIIGLYVFLIMPPLLILFHLIRTIFNFASHYIMNYLSSKCEKKVKKNPKHEFSLEPLVNQRNNPKKHRRKLYVLLKKESSKNEKTADTGEKDVCKNVQEV